MFEIYDYLEEMKKLGISKENGSQDCVAKEVNTDEDWWQYAITHYREIYMGKDNPPNAEHLCEKVCTMEDWGKFWNENVSEEDVSDPCVQLLSDLNASHDVVCACYTKFEEEEIEKFDCELEYEGSVFNPYQTYKSCPAETTEAPKDVILVDGPCPEGTEIVDSTGCEDAANELSLAWVSKYEDKNTRAGCFKMSAGLAPGVYFNAHPEAPAMDNRESYTSICRLVRETTLPTMAPVDEPVCEKVCMADVDEVSDDVEALKKDVDYLLEDFPPVLANTFQSVADLTKMVEDLQKEVARLTELVDDHQDKFSCLAGDKMEE